MVYLTSSFSLQMIPRGGLLQVERRKSLPTGLLVECEVGEGKRDDRVSRFCNFVSFVGHEGTAKLLSKMLGYPVEVNRASLILKEDETMVIAQPVGNRLVPGQELQAPDLAFFVVTVLKPLKQQIEAATKAAWTEGYRKGNPYWLDEEEAREDEQAQAGEGISCPACQMEAIFGRAGENIHTCGIAHKT